MFPPGSVVDNRVRLVKVCIIKTQVPEKACDSFCKGLPHHCLHNSTHHRPSVCCIPILSTCWVVRGKLYNTRTAVRISKHNKCTLMISSNSQYSKMALSNDSTPVFSLNGKRTKAFFYKIHLTIVFHLPGLKKSSSF